MKPKSRKLNDRQKEIITVVCICILFYLCVSNIGKVFGVFKALLKTMQPVIIGAVTAYVLDPFVSFFSEKVFKKIKRGKLNWVVSVIVTVVITLGLLTAAAASVIPHAIEAVVTLSDNVPRYIDNLQSFIAGVDGPVKVVFEEFIQELTEEGGILNKLGTMFTDNIRLILSTTSSIGGSALNVTIGAIFAIYFLFAKKSVSDAFFKLLGLSLSPLEYTRAKIVLEKFNTIFKKYITCEIIDSAIVGFANYAFMYIMGMPSTLIISIIAAVTNLVPNFGPIAGAGVSGFILLLQDPGFIFPYLIFTIAIQTVDAYIIKPKLFGGVLNVSGLVILIAIIVLGNIWGVKGMLIAIPLGAFIVYLYSEVLIPWLELKQDLANFRKEQEKLEKEKSADTDASK